MKKVKLFTLSAAIILATAGAFATRPSKAAHKQVLYHRDNYTGAYLPIQGGYICTQSYDSCSYYYSTDDNRYHAIELGTYVPQ